MTPHRVRNALPLLLLGALAMLGGCESRRGAAPPGPRGQQGADASGFPRTLKDSRGKVLTLAKPPMRIVSLTPSNTEILFALGAGQRVVGDTTACDYPAEARNRTHVGGFQIDIEKVRALNPDLIVGVDLLQQRTLLRLDQAGLPVAAVDMRTIPQVYDAIRLLGRATGQEKQATRLVAGMMTRIETTRRFCRNVRSRPGTLLMHSADPIFTTGPGSYIDEVVTLAGGRNIVDRPLPTDIISAEQVLARQPEVILCSPGLEPKIRQIPGWAQGVPAVRNNRLYNIQKGGIGRPGPRLAYAVEQLARYLHPELPWNRMTSGARAGLTGP